MTASSRMKELNRLRQYSMALDMGAEVIAGSDFNNPDYLAVLKEMGTAYYFTGKLSKAIECFQIILQKEPKHTDAAICLSVILNDIGKYDDAKKVYQIANQSLQTKSHGADLLLDRKFSLKHAELAEMYFKFHRYDEALDDFAKALRLDPTNLHLRIKIAKCYAKKGFNTRAIQELTQVCAENENFVDARIQLGLMHFSQGNVINAQEEWEQAYELAPNNPEIKEYLAMAESATETKI